VPRVGPGLIGSGRVGWGRVSRLHERLLSEHVLLKSRHAVERVKRLLDDFLVRVDRALEISDVDVVVKIPAVTERHAQRTSILGVRVQLLSLLQQRCMQAEI